MDGVEIMFLDKLEPSRRLAHNLRRLPQIGDGGVVDSRQEPSAQEELAELLKPKDDG